MVQQEDGVLLTKFGVRNLADFLQRYTSIGYVAIRDGIAIGFACGYSMVDPFDGRKLFYLYTLDILPLRQNNGQGKAFMEYIVKSVLSGGFDELFLSTHKSNERMSHICKSLGGISKADDDTVFEFHSALQEG